MAQDDIEDDDLSRLKNWWRNNGISLVVGAAAGLAVIIGWQSWQAYADSQARAAATAYAELEQTMAGGDAEPKAVMVIVERLQSDFAGSPYAARAGLAAADFLVAREDYPAADKRLQWVVDYAEQKPLRHVARVRQARLLWAEGQTKAALELLALDHPPAFASLYAELTGDIYAAAGDDGKARQAYVTALDSLPGESDAAPLQRKLDDVSGEDASGDEASRDAGGAAGAAL